LRELPGGKGDSLRPFPFLSFHPFDRDYSQGLLTPHFERMSAYSLRSQNDRSKSTRFERFFWTNRIARVK
jgi:hypothetical protein